LSPWRSTYCGDTSSRGCVRRSQCLAGYEAVRADPRRFLVLPGHENDQFGTVVESTASYLVVEKQGQAGRIADRTDPRT